jgi:hypothetical protein
MHKAALRVVIPLQLLAAVGLALFSVGCGPKFVYQDVYRVAPGTPRGYVLFYPAKDMTWTSVFAQINHTPPGDATREPPPTELGHLSSDGIPVRLRVACEPGNHTFEVGASAGPDFGETVPAQITINVEEGFTTVVKVDATSERIGPTAGDMVFAFFGIRPDARYRYAIKLEPKAPRPATEPIEIPPE